MRLRYKQGIQDKMTHPVTKCPVAAALWERARRSWTLWQFVQNLFATLEHPLLCSTESEIERREQAWQEAWDLYSQHVNGCALCRAAMKEMEEV